MAKVSQKIKAKDFARGKCEIKDCNNLAYAINKLTPIVSEWVCRKHYYDFNYGITYRYWAKDRS